MRLKSDEQKVLVYSTSRTITRTLDEVLEISGDRIASILKKFEVTGYTKDGMATDLGKHVVRKFFTGVLAVPPKGKKKLPKKPLFEPSGDYFEELDNIPSQPEITGESNDGPTEDDVQGQDGEGVGS